MSNPAMSNHVPGPWKVGGGRICRVLAIDHDRHYTVATVHNGKFTPDANEANARLIAAAPELLEALEEIDMGANHLATGAVAWENAPILIQQFIDIARGAIAKAKGE